MGDESLILGEEVNKLNYEVKPGDIVFNVDKQTVVVPFPTDYMKLYQFLKFQREAYLEAGQQWKSERLGK